MESVNCMSPLWEKLKCSVRVDIDPSSSVSCIQTREAMCESGQSTAVQESQAYTRAQDWQIQWSWIDFSWNLDLGGLLHFEKKLCLEDEETVFGYIQK